MRSRVRRLVVRVRRRVAARAVYRRNLASFLELRNGRAGSSDFPMGDPRPCLYDRLDKGGVAGGQYFHQDLLVAQWIHAASPVRHLDVGSRIDGFIAHVASFRPVEVVELRPVRTSASNITFHQRDIMSVDPSWDDCCDSLSCLHTIEHFGLGRYGDPIDPDGWIAGWCNLVRMVEPGGTIYLSTMIGPQRIEFDAHRVFAVPTLLALVADTCEIDDVAYIDDAGELHVGVDYTGAEAQRSFGCRDGCVVLRLRRR